MTATSSYGQGGDSQAIARVANAYYGGYRAMFEAHGWVESGNKMMTAAPGLIVAVYGSVRAFDELHAPGPLMFPMEAIRSEPPNVWLTSFHGFSPEEWGFVGFSDEIRRNSFLSRSKPGVLVAVYGTGRASADKKGKIIGILQCSHQTGPAKQFMSPQQWELKERDPEARGKWNFAVKCLRAWRVIPESRMNVGAFAPVATRSRAWQHIGAQGEPLGKQEALNILKLDLKEIGVYGENPIVASASGSAKQILAPSRAGPVSQVPYVVREAEGPKHLYILRLHGDTDSFLGEPAQGLIIVKAGFSRSPEMRREDFNRSLPRCAFRWEIMKSGPLSGFPPHPSSDHAKRGERAMHEFLCREPGCRSLGGEFFLASHGAIDSAWLHGNKTAKEFVS